MNSSDEYYNLIKNWHIKASEEDYFARFMFEYLAFIAYLKTQWLSEIELQSMRGTNRVNDRDYIQALKQDPYFNDFWTDVSLRAPKNKELDVQLKELVAILKKEPLRSDSEWWNYAGFDFNTRPQGNNLNFGVINSIGDFSNLIEYWYCVRNNLFHGEKSPSIERDKVLVKYAFLTLNYFVEHLLLRPTEARRLYPASWEDFWHRFKRGEAEVTTAKDNFGACANIYELIFLKDYQYPILILDKKLKKENIIEIISEEISISGELAPNIVERLKSAANTPERKKDLELYFGEIIKRVNQTFGFKLTFV